ncbi:MULTISPECIES: glycosyltransferase family A protein [unclassified Shinella]|uniref:glycosyltransferase family 2 protein n=1 Tax=unclassified Shinella TaxID=2643062 RepID=UPI00234E6715|nr:MULTISPECIES: glycosyltransferase family A protein [unclassified Shinella]MCO5153703.1 glycosyltransferase family 2 protein [Shinella sp.]MDC7259958.1 glycosyltransferase family 2 protein [Shinella sp. YE25]
MAVSLYNYANYIEECLDSIAAQDFSDIQLVIVDDCSQKDDSVGVAQAWMRKNKARFPSGILLRHEENSGLSEVRNSAFRAATCDAVFVMDADNVIYPACLRKLRRALIAADADAAYSQLVMFGDITDIGLADYWSKALLAEGPYIDAMALVHKRVWERVGGYTHLDGGWEDYDFWCKLIEFNSLCCYVPEFLGKYRVHTSSMLRTDTVKSYERLFNIISMRHPWTKLK